MARPGGPTTLLTCARGEWRKHSLDVGGVCRDTNGCIVIGGVGLVSRHRAPGAAIWRSSALRHGVGALRHGAGALRHAWQRARHSARQGPVLQYKVCIVTGRRRQQRCDTVCQRKWRYERSRLRHGHDTTLYAPRHGAQHAACARPGRNACSVCPVWALGVHPVHLTQF